MLWYKMCFEPKLWILNFKFVRVWNMQHLTKVQFLIFIFQQRHVHRSEIIHNSFITYSGHTQSHCVLSRCLLLWIQKLILHSLSYMYRHFPWKRILETVILLPEESCTSSTSLFVLMSVTGKAMKICGT